MDAMEKVDLLGRAAQYDLCGGCGSRTSRVRDDLQRWIYPAVRPDGKRVALLKVLQSNVCEKDCSYCGNRSGRDVRRQSLTPDELARTFDSFARRGLVQGLFLSSGVWGSAARASERMLATVELVRRRYGFKGYVHLKILPGADDACVEAAVRMAHRVSVNLEAPNAQRIPALSSTKDFGRELLGPLLRADRVRRHLERPVSITTQFVVGAADESDRELLTTSASLYNAMGLARAYYSAFQPIRDTPLENHPATPTWREHRLYQADFLLRQYGFSIEEIVFDPDGKLPRHTDPKRLWALQHPGCFPVEINTASHAQLLRVPGIGPKSAQKIAKRRRLGTLSDVSHLGLSKATLRRAAPFVLLDGRQPAHQLQLWGERSHL